MGKYAGKIIHVTIHSTFCILNILLAACVPDFAEVACSTLKCELVFFYRIFCVVTGRLCLSSMVVCEEMCCCSGGKPDVTDHVVTAKLASITCEEFDNPAVW